MGSAAVSAPPLLGPGVKARGKEQGGVEAGGGRNTMIRCL